MPQPISVLVLFQLLLLIAKFFGLTHISWWLILLPAWSSLIAFLVVSFLVWFAFIHA